MGADVLLTGLHEVAAHVHTLGTGVGAVGLDRYDLVANEEITYVTGLVHGHDLRAAELEVKVGEVKAKAPFSVPVRASGHGPSAPARGRCGGPLRLRSVGRRRYRAAAHERRDESRDQKSEGRNRAFSHDRKSLRCSNARSTGCCCEGAN